MSTTILPKKCSLVDCTKPVHAKRYCRKHYQRFLKHGNPNKLVKVMNTGRVTHPMYARYRAMIQRCYYPKNVSYKNYGGRGITVCDRWLGNSGFDNYVADIGLPPDSDRVCLDRIDNELNYTKENMRWTDWSTQNLNKRKYAKK